MRENDAVARRGVTTIVCRHEEIDEEIRKRGGDPEVIGARGVALAELLGREQQMLGRDR